MSTFKQHLHAIRAKFWRRPSYVKLGGSALSGPPDSRNIQYSGATALAVVIPQIVEIPITSQKAIGYQYFEDCGPWAKSYMDFIEFNGLNTSPHFSYYYARQVNNALPYDNGTTASSLCSVGNKRGSVGVSIDPYTSSSLNTVPSAVALSTALDNLTSYQFTPTLQQVQQAIFDKHLVCLQFSATNEWYYPTLCSDGSYEIHTPTSLSTSIDGHFAVVDKIDLTRKMIDGTIGGLRVVCAWGTTWGQAGRSWISVAGWFNKNGDPGSRFVCLSMSPVPQTPTTLKVSGTLTISGGIVSWTSMNALTATLNGKTEQLNGNIKLDGSPKYDLILTDLTGKLPSDGSGWLTVYAPKE